MSVANSYAKALLESAQALGTSASAVDQIQEHLSTLAELVVGSKDLHLVLQSPATSSRDKEKVAGALVDRMGADPLLKRFVLLLARKERLILIQEIATAFERIRLESAGGVLGQVVSAGALSAQDVAELSEVFEKKTGKKVSFKTQVDSSLIAGLRVTVQGKTYDGSLKTQLNRLKDRFLS